MSNKPELKTDPGRDPERRDHQAQVKKAIVEGQAWGLTYLLARVKDRAPYSNYSVPDDLEKFEFTVKGVLRLEMLDHKVLKGWRRMFGSNTKAREISTWRSRALIKVFGNLVDARSYIQGDPLVSWKKSMVVLPENLPPDSWYVLFQVQDVWLVKGKYRWSDLLAQFLLDDSRLLKLVGTYESLPPIMAGGGNDA